MAIWDFNNQEKIMVKLRTGEMLDYKGEHDAKNVSAFFIGSPGRKVTFIPWDIIEKVKVKLEG